MKFWIFCIKVTLRKTGQIMVMKETKTFDKEAQKIFVKEVKDIHIYIHSSFSLRLFFFLV
jgi:hypothetical protein